jgi:hypothetical protein
MPPYEDENGVIKALQTLVDCSAALENEPLKQQVCHHKDTILQQAESYCRKTVGFLVESLPVDNAMDVRVANGALAYDLVWTLHLMAKCSKVAKQWVKDAGIMASIPRVMTSFQEHKQLLEEGTWITYCLNGLGGVAELIANGSSCMKLQESAAWAVHSLANKQRGADDPGSIEWLEADVLVRVLLDALSAPNATIDLSTICCKTLRLLTHQHADRSNLFLQQGGGAATIKALRVGGAAIATGDDQGRKLLMAAARLMTSLVDGNTPAVAALLEQGALVALVESGLGQGGDDLVLYDALWALGEIGGPYAILEVMQRRTNDEHVRKKCLAVYAKMLWKLQDVDVEQQRPILETLVKLTEHYLKVRTCCTDSTGDQSASHLSAQKNCVEALGGVLNSLSSHAWLGSFLPACEGVRLLIQATGTDYNERVARSAASSLGHMAASSAAWKQSLIAHGQFISILGQRILHQQKSEKDDIGHQRCFCWVATIIGGLPVVTEVMTSKISSPTLQQAAICALIDILEDNSECAMAINVDQVHQTMEALSMTMSQHRARAPVQYKAIHALGLLHNVSPPSHHLPAVVLEGVLGALKTHPTEYKVARAVCRALRLFLSPRVGADRESSHVAIRRAIEVLQGQRCGDVVGKLLGDWSQATDKELFVDAAFVLGLVQGPHIPLRQLEKSKPEFYIVRAGLIKGLFELVQSFNDILQPPHLLCAITLLQRVLGEAAASAADSPSGVINESAADVIMAAQLLGGLLEALALWQGLGNVQTKLYI